MSSTGTRIATASTSSVVKLGGSGRVCRNQAQASGTAIFMISEGWKRTTPRSSQRCAPMEMSPTSATATSSSTPAAYAQGETARSNRGGTCAAATSTAKAMPTRAAWRTNTPRSSPAALKSTTSPTAHTASTASSSGPSRCSASSTRPDTVKVRFARLE